MDPNRLAQQLKDDKLPPVDQWNPPFCGDMDMVIKRDGSWHYMGTPIGRQKLVKLFSTILRKDGDEYFLVTPVEKVRIQVEDAPFVAVSLEVKQHEQEPMLEFTDNVGNVFVAGEEHPIWVNTNPETQEPSPYIRVRKNLDALIHRNVFYQLVELADHNEIDGKTCLVIHSQGKEFVLGAI